MCMLQVRRRRDAPPSEYVYVYDISAASSLLNDLWSQSAGAMTSGYQRVFHAAGAARALRVVGPDPDAVDGKAGLMERLLAPSDQDDRPSDTAEASEGDVTGLVVNSGAGSDVWRSSGDGVVEYTIGLPQEAVKTMIKIRCSSIKRAVSNQSNEDNHDSLVAETARLGRVLLANEIGYLESLDEEPWINRLVGRRQAVEPNHATWEAPSSDE